MARLFSIVRVDVDFVDELCPSLCQTLTLPRTFAIFSLDVNFILDHCPSSYHLLIDLPSQPTQLQSLDVVTVHKNLTYTQYDVSWELSTNPKKDASQRSNLCGGHQEEPSSHDMTIIVKDELEKMLNT